MPPRRPPRSRAPGESKLDNAELAGPLREERGRVLAALRVSPRAARDDLTFDGTTLHVRVSAPPVGGAANAAVIALLAHRLRLPKSSIEIVRGAGTRDKVVAIEGIGAAELRARLER